MSVHDDLNADARGQQRPCPHCQQPAGILGLDHWRAELDAKRVGLQHCPKSPRKISRDYWGFACPDRHTCFVVDLAQMPVIPGSKEALANDPHASTPD